MNQRHSRYLPAMVAIVALASASYGCEIIYSVDRNKISGVGGAGAQGGGGAGNMGGAGAGGMLLSCVEMDCAATGTECQPKECDTAADTCQDAAPTAEGTSCDANMTGPYSGVCDGAGICLPLGCTNATKDDDETDVDCGGADCNVSAFGRCLNTKDCEENADCKSNICTAMVCVPCTVAADCRATDYCNVDNTIGEGGVGGGGDPTRGPICVPKKMNGETCGASGGAAECGSDFCVDGVCCNAACDSAECESCLGADTGGTDGICAPVSAGTDPANECIANISGNAVNGCEGNACSGTAAACAPAAAATPCRATTGVCDIPESCDGIGLGCPIDAVAANGIVCKPQSGVCDVADLCDGTTKSCTDAFLPQGFSTNMCGGHLCDGGGKACPNSCTENTDCESTHFCPVVDTTCTVKGATGVACVSGAECQSGVCDVNLCT